MAPSPTPANTPMSIEKQKALAFHLSLAQSSYSNHLTNCLDFTKDHINEESELEAEEGVVESDIITPLKSKSKPLHKVTHASSSSSSSHNTTEKETGFFGGSGMSTPNTLSPITKAGDSHYKASPFYGHGGGDGMEEYEFDTEKTEVDAMTDKFVVSSPSVGADVGGDTQRYSNEILQPPPSIVNSQHLPAQTTHKPDTDTVTSTSTSTQPRQNFPSFTESLEILTTKQLLLKKSESKRLKSLHSKRHHHPTQTPKKQTTNRTPSTSTIKSVRTPLRTPLRTPPISRIHSPYPPETPETPNFLDLSIGTRSALNEDIIKVGIGGRGLGTPGSGVKSSGWFKGGNGNVKERAGKCNNFDFNFGLGSIDESDGYNSDGDYMVSDVNSEAEGYLNRQGVNPFDDDDDDDDDGNNSDFNKHGESYGSGDDEELSSVRIEHLSTPERIKGKSVGGEVTDRRIDYDTDESDDGCDSDSDGVNDSEDDYDAEDYDEDEDENDNKGMTEIFIQVMKDSRKKQNQIPNTTANSTNSASTHTPVRVQSNRSNLQKSTPSSGILNLGIALSPIVSSYNAAEVDMDTYEGDMVIVNEPEYNLLSTPRHLNNNSNNNNSDNDTDKSELLTSINSNSEDDDDDDDDDDENSDSASNLQESFFEASLLSPIPQKKRGGRAGLGGEASTNCSTNCSINYVGEIDGIGEIDGLPFDDDVDTEGDDDVDTEGDNDDDDEDDEGEDDGDGNEDYFDNNASPLLKTKTRNTQLPLPPPPQPLPSTMNHHNISHSHEHELELESTPHNSFQFDSATTNLNSNSLALGISAGDGDDLLIDMDAHLKAGDIESSSNSRNVGSAAFAFAVTAGSSGRFVRNRDKDLADNNSNSNANKGNANVNTNANQQQQQREFRNQFSSPSVLKPRNRYSVLGVIDSNRLYEDEVNEFYDYDNDSNGDSNASASASYSGVGSDGDNEDSVISLQSGQSIQSVSLLESFNNASRSRSRSRLGLGIGNDTVELEPSFDYSNSNSNTNSNGSNGSGSRTSRDNHSQTQLSSTNNNTASPNSNSNSSSSPPLSSTPKSNNKTPTSTSPNSDSTSSSTSTSQSSSRRRTHLEMLSPYSITNLMTEANNMGITDFESQWEYKEFMRHRVVGGKRNQNQNQSPASTGTVKSMMNSSGGGSSVKSLNRSNFSNNAASASASSSGTFGNNDDNGNGSGSEIKDVEYYNSTYNGRTFVQFSDGSLLDYNGSGGGGGGGGGSGSGSGGRRGAKSTAEEAKEFWARRLGDRYAFNDANHV